MGNGNTESGEGWKYRGRGPIQLTGKENYIECGKALSLELEENPDQINQNPVTALRVACWYWDKHKLNDFADYDKLKVITKKINGEYKGLAHRTKLYERAAIRLQTEKE